MNRTVERILGIIGIAMDVLIAIFALVLLIVVTSSIDWIIDPISTQFEFINNFLFIFAQLLWIPIISSLVTLTLGLIAVVKVKTNAKLAGSLFIAGAVISSWFLFTIGSFQSLLYLVSGIMCFVKKTDREVPL
ncbi:DUF4064 domain-containing protein [Virgibacillus oceani]|uniref:DUF4064 domain-containing protein n=1 Tax=Virgibacillus oceani TaxID=1479511 RepID=A0A917M5M9_9BACI|nr:DUF4064 domain-containing protein [Virgibacillus oceani]GGG80607.1 hypothetical protein GCM10011398_27510 [Virgibacillus oceani]